MKPTFNNSKGFSEIELEQIENHFGKPLPFYLRNFTVWRKRLACAR